MSSAASKKLVAAGYDVIAARYLEWSSGSRVRLHYLGKLLELLPPHGAQVLELGCGAGVPVSRVLAERCSLTAVDISPAQIDRACRAAPTSAFLCADMMSITFPPAHFDVVTAFYAITHVPRSEHAELLGRIFTWLRAGGWLLASFGSKDCMDVVVPDWLGAPNFFSHFDAVTNFNLIQDAGFEIVEHAIVPQDEEGEQSIEFLWAIARKPASASEG